MLWYEADYFKDFRCKCGECRSSCCDAWEIAVTEKEFHRLSNLSCSDSLYHKLQCAFKRIDNPAPERFMLFARNFIGKCPMHDENGLCALQVEMGADMIPEVCRVYPRSMHIKGGKHRAVCSAGCEAVIEQLFHHDHVDIIESEDDLPVDMVTSAEENFLVVFKKTISLMKDRSISIRERIISVCNELDPEFVPNNDPTVGISELIRSIDVLKKYSPTLSDISESIGDRYNNIEAFMKDRALLDSFLKDREYLIENLLINHLLYSDFPETDPRISSRDSLYGLCLAYALIRLCFIANFRNGETNVIDALTAAFRYIEHSSFYYNARVICKHPEVLTAV